MTKKSSPHTRGCFRVFIRQIVREMVFPAYAGVFPVANGFRIQKRGLPRIRGGVSSETIATMRDMASSPHTRGCFSRRACRHPPDGVFPAYAGVFPSL